MTADLGKRISERIDRLEMDQSEVAGLAKISVQRLNNYIHGRRMPDLSTLVRLASVLATSTDWLLGARDDRLALECAVWTELLKASGRTADEALTMTDAAAEALRLLSVLPDEGDVVLRSRMAAHAAWHSRSSSKPH